MNEPFIPTNLPATTPLEPGDRAALEEAVRLLERESFPMRISGIVGGAANRGLQALFSRIPFPIRHMVEKVAGFAASRALETAYRSVLPTLGQPAKYPFKPTATDRAITSMLGALGGAGGPLSTAVELPITTGVLLRAIARIAHENGEDPRDPETKAECMKVLALGAPDGETYFAARFALSEAISAATGKMVTDLLPRVMTAILPRYSMNVTWKFAGQAIPLVGAASGAMLNYAFTAHYQGKARGHFVVRRLERRYGAPLIQEYYEKLRGAVPLTDAKFTAP